MEYELIDIRLSGKELKCGVAFTGTKTINGRNSLLNRSLLIFNGGETSIGIANKIYDWLVATYGEIQNIVVVGDGATWITEVAKNLGAKRFIDRFHYKKLVKDLVGRKTKIDWELILKMSKSELETYLLKLLANENGEVCFTKSQEESFKRIIKFLASFQEISQQKYICCIEGIQANYVASALKNRRSFNLPMPIKLLL